MTPWKTSFCRPGACLPSIFQGPTATIGVFVNSGSVYETPFNSGVSNLLERMAYKSTSNRTHFRVVREIEAIGGNFLSSASREQMVYTADVIKAFVPEAVELLADTVRNSVYNEWEVSEAVSRHGSISEASWSWDPGGRRVPRFQARRAQSATMLKHETA